MQVLAQEVEASYSIAHVPLLSPARASWTFRPLRRIMELTWIMRLLPVYVTCLTQVPQKLLPAYFPSVYASVQGEGSSGRLCQ